MTFENHFIENYTFNNKNVLIRVDWNIPFNKDFEITDHFRIISSLKTINYIYQNNPNRIIIISHLGRPNNKFDLKYSWENFIKQIEKYFYNIILLKDGISELTLHKLKLEESNIYLLENIRFHDEETEFTIKSDNKIQKIFNLLGDIYVNDAFSCMHRNHLSISGFYKNEKAYGYLVKNEMKYLDILLNNNANDKILSIIGGSKINDKIMLLNNLSMKVNGIYISGGLINSILKDRTYREEINKIKNNKAKIYEMKDGLATNNINNIFDYYSSEELPSDKYFYDIGILSLIELENIVKDYDIIFWNGPLGLIEDKLYDNGSYILIQILLKSKKKIIIGGGDTAGFVSKFYNKFEFISTAGGASIEYISNGTLIGLDMFKDQ